MLSVKRSPENKNSLYEQLRGIQATCKVSRGESLQSALHRYGDRAARSENGAGFVFACGGQKLRETAIDAGDEGLPGFDAVDRPFSVDPHGDNGIEEFLKVSAALRGTVCSLNSGFEIADMGISLDKVREAFFQHNVALKFVKFVEHDRFRKIQAIFRISLAHTFFGVAMAETRASANAIECDFVASPILSQNTRLGFADGGKLVVVRLKERSLCVANQKNASHASPEKTASLNRKDISQW